MAALCLDKPGRTTDHPKSPTALRGRRNANFEGPSP